MSKSYQRWLILVALLVTIGALVLWLRPWVACKGPPTPRPPVKRPSVLLISLDTLRPDHLGCYGYPRPTSPNLDRFAARSLRFTNCRAQAPWTLPSHMSLFTSMRPSRNGVDSLNKVLGDDVPTLAELLRGAGYRTAALVNNGQMRAHWGFNRGFDSWRELEVDTDAGNCESITAEALTWLQSAGGPEPFFLFLHYYDTHDPYAAPESFRKKLGATLTGAEARRLCFGHRNPDRPLDIEAVSDLKCAYDAEIAWLDSELGKLLDAVPSDTVVVVLSDHGEAFKEHGWTLHGATVYEEEVRVPLLMRLPGESQRPAVIDESVMLMDVTPTILTRCGVAPPAAFEGVDLGPLWVGKSLPPRLIPSESKAVLEGRVNLSLTLHPLKAVHSLLDGRMELYRLPDETESIAEADPAAAEALFQPLRAWAAEHRYWMIHAVGRGDYEATVELTRGRLGLFIPAGLDEMRDRFEVLDEGRAVRWHVYPGGGTKSLLLQPEDPSAALRVDFKRNGERVREQVFLGKDGKPPDSIPAIVPADVTPVSPVLERAFGANQPGFYVLRHAGDKPAGSVRASPLDEQTLRRLRSLGYVR